jgi:hypothetical protein
MDLLSGVCRFLFLFLRRGRAEETIRTMTLGGRINEANGIKACILFDALQKPYLVVE